MGGGVLSVFWGLEMCRPAGYTFCDFGINLGLKVSKIGINIGLGIHFRNFGINMGIHFRKFGVNMATFAKGTWKLF